MKREFQKIVLRMPNWLGDMVMATACLSDLRKAYPCAHLTVVCKKPNHELLLKDPRIDTLLSFTKEKKKEILAHLKEEKYDLGILLTHSFSSAWLFFRGRVGMRVGFNRDGRGVLLNGKVDFPHKQEEHLVETYRRLLSFLGIEKTEASPSLHLDEGELKEYKKALREKYGVNEEKILVFHPGAFYGSAKCWPEERFIQTAKEVLKRLNSFIFFVGDKSQSPLIKQICDAIAHPRIIDLSGKTTLRELAFLLKSASLVLTNDSGPMHVASALSTPLLALFGSTSPILTGPYNGGKTIWKKVACAPCFKRKCPIDFRCMRGISSQEVVEKIIRELGYV